MILNILERQQLSNLLVPYAGDMALIRVVRETRERLSFTEEEFELWEKPCDATKLCERYPETCPHRDVEIPLSKQADKLVKKILKELNDQKKVTSLQYTLIEKFCPELVDKDEEESK